MKEEERDSAWSDFLSEADSLPDVKIEPTSVARRSLSDRLAYLTLEGYLPLAALAAVLLSLTSDRDSATVWLVGLGLSYDEIGDTLKVAGGTVRSRLHKARTRLAERMTGAGG